MALTDVHIRSAKAMGTVYTLGDYDGLSLFVSAQGSKAWHFRYQWLGKRSWMSFGTYPELSLREVLDAFKLTQKYVFAGVAQLMGRMSESTVNFALKRMGYDGRLTGHGLRATLSTALNEPGINRPPGTELVYPPLVHMRSRKAIACRIYRIITMQERPAIPLLVLIPGEGGVDLDAIFAIAGAYARAGLLISDHGHRHDEPAFAFPAVVCAGFAVELYLKFFLMLGLVESGDTDTIQAKGHTLSALWGKLQPEHQALIAGMHRNKSGEPLNTAHELRMELFSKALTEIGDSPFMQWRYAHELTEISHMSHAVIQEVLDALESAACYVMRKRQEGDNKKASSDRGKSLVDGLAGSPSQQDWKIDPIGAAAKELSMGKPLLLGRESPVRRIPSNLEPNAAFHLDELRQAAESMDIAFSRLHHELTSLALQAPAPEEIRVISAHAFFDAWGVVAAVNRFYQAYVSFPRMVPDEQHPNHQTLEYATRHVRLLYKLSCDLKLREDKILSGGFPTLGEITWMTGVHAAPQRVAWYCTLRPGWMEAPPIEQNEPVMSAMNWPTDSITLTLAGTKADLSTARLHVAARFWHLEEQIFRAFNASEQKNVAIPNDFFSRRPVSPAEPEATD